MSRGQWNKIIWTREMISFIRKNYNSMTNHELAAHFGFSITAIRKQVYAMGLFRMILQYWTARQEKFLIKHYHTCGDKQLAEMFNKKWPKNKGWTLKHIEKKRMYLGLKRTKKELRAIKDKAIQKGVYVVGLNNAWMKRGQAKEGSIVIWATGSQYPTHFIKVNGEWHVYSRWLWRKHFGRIPKGKKVCMKEGRTKINSIDDLELLTSAQLSARNSKKSSQGLSDNYIAGMLTPNNSELRQEIKKFPHLLELKRQQLILNRTIYAAEVA